MSLMNITNADGIGVLQRAVEFAGRRHALIVHNVANLTTPNFQPVDVSPDSFREAMSRAVEDRREKHPGLRGGLVTPRSTQEIEFHRQGMTLSPRPAEHNVMFHDRNDRDIERMMQDMAENTMVYRQSTELLRNRFTLLSSAIRAKA
ncbi:MAG: flagellar basal body rod protein FlgB [Planctomycetota bacterium]